MWFILCDLFYLFYVIYWFIDSMWFYSERDSQTSGYKIYQDSWTKVSRFISYLGMMYNGIIMYIYSIMYIYNIMYSIV